MLAKKMKMLPKKRGRKRNHRNKRKSVEINASKN